MADSERAEIGIASAVQTPPTEHRRSQAESQRCTHPPRRPSPRRPHRRRQRRHSGSSTSTPPLYSTFLCSTLLYDLKSKLGPRHRLWHKTGVGRAGHPPLRLQRSDKSFCFTRLMPVLTLFPFGSPTIATTGFSPSANRHRFGH